MKRLLFLSALAACSGSSSPAPREPGGGTGDDPAPAGRCESDDECAVSCARPDECCGQLCSPCEQVWLRSELEAHETWHASSCEAAECPVAKCAAPTEETFARCEKGACVLDRRPLVPEAGPEEAALRDAAITDETLVGHATGCDGGDLAACAELGFAYSSGGGVTKDDERARALYTRACDGDVARGCAYLAGWLILAKDYPAALVAGEKACTAGDAIGCFNLGYMHSHGLGVAQDHKRAAELYTTACDAGVLDGCFNLAELAEKGQGGPKDPARAATYYAKVCEAGDAEACTKAEEMKKAAAKKKKPKKPKAKPKAPAPAAK